MLNRRTLGFLLFASAVVLGCVRLGFWQLSRLREKQQQNAKLSANLSADPAPVSEVLRSSAPARYRRVTVQGMFDYENEFVLTARSYDGSPGVHLITPYKIAGTNQSILVNRGWVYAADGMIIEAREWREPADSSGQLEGYLDEFGEAPSVVGTPSLARGIRRLIYDSLAARLPYPIERAVIVQQRPNIAAQNPVHPKRLRAPVITAGSHRSYAIQWFSFALIGVVGMVAVSARAKRGPLA